MQKYFFYISSPTYRLYIYILIDLSALPLHYIPSLPTLLPAWMGNNRQGRKGRMTDLSVRNVHYNYRWYVCEENIIIVGLKANVHCATRGSRPPAGRSHWIHHGGCAWQLAGGEEDLWDGAPWWKCFPITFYVSDPLGGCREVTEEEPPSQVLPRQHAASISPK